MHVSIKLCVPNNSFWSSFVLDFIELLHKSTFFVLGALLI